MAEFLIAEARDLDLANEPTWQKLLHFGDRGDRSQVISDSFFLSPEGRVDPAKELEATIRAYFDSSVVGDSEARCRFPARYFWLSQHLSLPGPALPGEACANFRRWALLEEVRSVSLYWVSGYFGNPASSFGHALLRLNTRSSDDQRGLFDLSINYGALVPENENTAVYIVRGLTGGYEAGFSDRYFYTQDQVYTRTEFRDVWDYELELDEYQRTLLVLHLWEILGVKFTYYFLKENCAYRLAELLELVIEERILTNAKVWYVPVEMFHRLKSIDEARRQKGERPILRSASPIPSSRRRLYEYFSDLDRESLELANELIADGVDADYARLHALSPERQMDVLDALLEYHQYKQVGQEPDPQPETSLSKTRVLAERLRRPVRLTPAPLPEMPTEPTAASRPMRGEIGWAVDQRGSSFGRIRWAGYSQEALSPTSLEGSELVVVDAALGHQDGKTFLDALDLIRIRKSNVAPVAIQGESRLSWQLGLGMRRSVFEELFQDDWRAAFGAGRTWRLGDFTHLSAVTLGSLHSAGPGLRLRPQLEIVTGVSGLQLAAYAGEEIYEQGSRSVLGTTLQIHFNVNRAVRLQYDSSFATRLSLSLVCYW